MCTALLLVQELCLQYQSWQKRHSSLNFVRNRGDIFSSSILRTLCFLTFLQTSLSGGKEVCQQAAIKLQLLQPTFKNWRGFVTLALVNCIYLELKWMNQFECTAHCMQCAVQLNYWKPVWLELVEYTEYRGASVDAAEATAILATASCATVAI